MSFNILERYFLWRCAHAPADVQFPTRGMECIIFSNICLGATLLPTALIDLSMVSMIGLMAANSFGNGIPYCWDISDSISTLKFNPSLNFSTDFKNIWTWTISSLLSTAGEALMYVTMFPSTDIHRPSMDDCKGMSSFRISYFCSIIFLELAVKERTMACRCRPEVLLTMSSSNRG